MALINEELSDWRSAAKQHRIEDRSHDDEIVLPNTKIDVAIVRKPRQPETLIDADDIIDKLIECDHEDYCLECAEDYLHNVSKEAKDDLTKAIQWQVEQWIYKWRLSPKWFVVDKRWTVTAGEIRAKAKEMGYER